MPVGSAVDTDALLGTVRVAPAAGFGIALSSSFTLLGMIRAQEAPENGDVLRMGAWGLVGPVGLTVFAAGIVLGLVALVNK